MSLIKKLITIKNEPFLLLVIDVLNKIPLKPIKLMAYHSYMLASEAIFNAKCEALCVSRASEADVKLINTSDHKKRLFLKRIQSGELCLIAVTNGIIVGYEWFTVTGIHIEERYNLALDIPGYALYAYDAFVLPEYRKRGVLTCIMNFAHKIMEDFDKTTIVLNIDYGNSVSEDAHYRLGFKKKYLHYFICVGPVKFNFKIARPFFQSFI